MRRFLLPLAVACSMLMVGCKPSSPSESSSSDSGVTSTNPCTEPENPYDEGSGHYAGFEWAERTGAGTCGGNSQSFIEGCEEYQRQQAEYEECEDNARD